MTMWKALGKMGKPFGLGKPHTVCQVFPRFSGVVSNLREQVQTGLVIPLINTPNNNNKILIKRDLSLRESVD
jgi:hypothetical protein